MEKNVSACFARIRRGLPSVEWPYGSMIRISRGIIVYLGPGFRLSKLPYLVDTARSIGGVRWLVVLSEAEGVVLEARFLDFPTDMREECHCVYRMIQSGNVESWTAGRCLDATRRLMARILVERRKGK